MFMNKTKKLKYTDEELIEWIKGFDTRREIREDDFNKYAVCLRRGLNVYFPTKETRCNNKVGSRKALTEKQIEKRKIEKERIKEEKRLLRESKKSEPKLDKTSPSRMYIGTQLENGMIICGRCLEEKKVSKQNKGLCSICYGEYMKLNAKQVDHNKWNIRDEFCHTQIRHHEKTFNIGIKVDQKLEDYLCRVGYQFLFKETYEK